MTPSRGETGDRETSRTWAHLSDVTGTYVLTPAWRTAVAAQLPGSKRKF